MGRPRVWLDEKSFVEEYKVLVPRPPRCVCGEDNYRFGVGNFHGSETVLATCNCCGYLRYYDQKKEKWGPYIEAH